MFLWKATCRISNRCFPAQIYSVPIPPIASLLVPLVSGLSSRLWVVTLEVICLPILPHSLPSHSVSHWLSQADALCDRDQQITPVSGHSSLWLESSKRLKSLVWHTKCHAPISTEAKKKMDSVCQWSCNHHSPGPSAHLSPRSGWSHPSPHDRSCHPRCRHHTCLLWRQTRWCHHSQFSRKPKSWVRLCCKIQWYFQADALQDLWDRFC